MPVAVEIADTFAKESAIEEIFSYFRYVDQKFSVRKKTSEITMINDSLIKEKDFSGDMETIFVLSEETKQLTNGYFDIISNEGKYDPSGLVKGWAIYNASKILKELGFKNFYVDFGGDIQTHGKNNQGESWRVGIQNPFSKKKQIIKTIQIEDKGVATSGTYVRGQHIYNPKNRSAPIEDIVSLTVIGPNVYEADRFATAAFAMGKKGINFIESLKDFEGYVVAKDGIATMTSGFEKYTI